MELSARFPGMLVVIAPHQDDETLACGGLMALLAATREIHVIFATDGTRSPVPNAEVPNVALVQIREDEARDALGVLGVPPERAHFLRFPDGRLQRDTAPFEEALLSRLRALRPATVLVPFRYDWHPDHRVVHAVAAAAFTRGDLPGTLVEYFVYTQRRLLPAGDVRVSLDPAHLWQVDTAAVAARKRAALECFRSQTTRYFPWQKREILTPDVLDRACRSSEFFLPFAPTLRTRPWIPEWYIALADRLEPRLKRVADALLVWRRRP